MASLHNQKPEKVIKALESTEWISKRPRGGHVNSSSLEIVN